MTTDEVIQIMDKKKTNALVPQYRVIYEMATGKKWNKCFCGNGFETFYKVCKNYAEALKKQKLNNITIITE